MSPYRHLTPELRMGAEPPTGSPARLLHEDWSASGSLTWSTPVRSVAVSEWSLMARELPSDDTDRCESSLRTIKAASSVFSFPAGRPPQLGAGAEFVSFGATMRRLGPFICPLHNQCFARHIIWAPPSPLTPITRLIACSGATGNLVHQTTQVAPLF